MWVVAAAVFAMTYNSMLFPRLHEQWEHSCICNRCGAVFLG